MATTPQTPAKSNPPAQHHDANEERRAAAHEQAERDPHQVREQKDAARAERRRSMENAPPITNEQMERSREIETMGVTEWQRTQDQRPEDEQPVLVKDALPIGDVLNTPQGASKQVPGVSHPTTPLPERAPVRDGEGNAPRR